MKIISQRYIIFFSILSEIILMICIFYYNYNHIEFSNFQIGIGNIFLFSLFLVPLIYFCIKNEKLFYFFVLILGFLIVFLNTPYSPIDEAAHFDYINYIIEYHNIPHLGLNINVNILSKLTTNGIPQMENHEFVQPPLFYIITALFSGWIKNITYRFYFIRLFNVIYLLIVCHYVIKIKNLFLSNYNIPNYNLNSILLLLIMNPGIITRIITISNESLLIVLSTIICYYFFKYIYGNKVSKFLVTILCISAFLTKITGIVFIILWIFILFYQKKIKDLIFNSVMWVIGVSPWIIFNLINYGKITGNSIHINIVKPIVNPNNTNLTISSFLLETKNIILTFFLPQEESNTSDPLYSLIIFWGVLLIIFYLIFLYNVIKKCLAKIIRKRDIFCLNKETILQIVVFSCIIGNTLACLIATVKEDVALTVGRYWYMSIASIFLIILFLFIMFNDSLLIKVFLILSVIIFSFSWCSILFSYLLNIDIPYKREYKIDFNVDLESKNIMTNEVILDYSNSNLVINSGNDDPQIFNLLNSSSNISFHTFVKIKYESSFSGEGRIYYKVNEMFNEYYSQSFYIDENKKEIILDNSIINNNFSDIRIDPPDNITFKIKSIEIIH